MSPPPRLRTTANYSRLSNPQALACQTLPPSTSHYGSPSSSLAAIYASNGIVLFPTHQPYEPLLVLPQHHTQSKSFSSQQPQSPNIESTYLSFSTQNQQNKLASTHANTVLLWDTSGQSLQPIMARLSVGYYSSMYKNDTKIQTTGSTSTTATSSSSSSSSKTTATTPNSSTGGAISPIGSSFIALDWNKHNDTIHASFENTISTWDIRVDTRSNINGDSHLRPTFNIIVGGGGGSSSSSISSRGNHSKHLHPSTVVSLTSSFHHEYEIACIDAMGNVRIYDQRMNSSSNHGSSSDNSNTKEICHFWAHQNGGFGIASISGELDDASKSNEPMYGYITWGLEKVETRNNGNDNSPRISNTTPTNPSSISFVNSIKLWKEGDSDQENYWVMDNHDTTTTDNDTTVSTIYKCCAIQPIDNLATVRICPQPFEGGIITTSTPTANSETTGNCQVDLWKIGFQSFDIITSFCGADDTMADVLGDNFSNRPLIASELTLGSSLTRPMTSHQDIELSICCLNDAGFVTTYAIPEATVLRRDIMNGGSDGRLSRENSFHRGSSQHLPLSKSHDDLVSNNNYNHNSNNNNKKVGRARGLSDLGPNLNSVNANLSYANFEFIDENGEIENIKDSIQGEGYLRLQLDDDQLYQDDFGLDDRSDTSNQKLGSINMNQNRRLDANQELDMNGKDEIGETDEEIKVDPAKAKRVPSPRLCGAIFGHQGGLITFHNGEVKKMWKWYSESRSPESNMVSFEAKGVNNSDNFNALQFFQHDQLEILSVSNVNEIGGFPRNLFELIQMKDKAILAQWGSEDEDNENDIEEDSFYSSDDSGDSVADIFGLIDLPEYRKPTGNTRPRSDSIFGPTTESLVPVVSFTSQYDALIMNGQSAALANLWLFGPWSSEIAKEKLDQNSNINTSSSEASKNILTTANKLDYSNDPAFRQEPLVHIDRDAPSAKPSTPNQRNISRNMNHESSETIKMKASRWSGHYNEKSNEYIQLINRARDICVHNGTNTKSEEHDTKDRKAVVWNLLAEVLDNLNSDIGDEFDGWKGFANGSLGRNLLGEMFRYYELQRDVQMLATIVSVIRNGPINKDERFGIRNSNLLLPRDDDECDKYIDLYSNMLYCWGFYEESTELKKHLRSPSSHVSAVQTISAYIPCTSCENSTPTRCEHCPPLKCSICTERIRGQYTICSSCGHAGHLEHMEQWFSKHEVCPTGCGCKCMIAIGKD